MSSSVALNMWKSRKQRAARVGLYMVVGFWLLMVVAIILRGVGIIK